VREQKQKYSAPGLSKTSAYWKWKLLQWEVGLEALRFHLAVLSSVFKKIQYAPSSTRVITPESREPTGRFQGLYHLKIANTWLTHPGSRRQSIHVGTLSYLDTQPCKGGKAQAELVHRTKNIKEPARSASGGRDTTCTTEPPSRTPLVWLSVAASFSTCARDKMVYFLVDNGEGEREKSRESCTHALMWRGRGA